MRATGIVRRIDELGRVVIPKEIRRTMKIREGEELEVFTAEDNSLILKKYSAVNEMEQLVRDYTAAIFQTTGYTAVICDMDKIIAVSGDMKVYKTGDALSFKGEKLLQERKPRILNGKDVFPMFVEDITGIAGMAVAPILNAGDIMGALVLVSPRDMGEVAAKLSETGASFLAGQL